MITKRNGVIALWITALVAQCTIYIVKFPRMLDAAKAANLGELSVSGALLTALLGISAWIFVLVLPLSKRHGLRVTLETAACILLSIGLCISALTK